MSGFSPEWLALREPVDHRSRDRALARALAGRLKRDGPISIVDLGCGSGSNIRATAPLLGPRQAWTLVDYDPRLLAAARAALGTWADSATVDGDSLVLSKSGATISVAFRETDLNRDLDAALGAAPDLVTASAFFDLCSTAFIETFATAVASRRPLFYTVLTYDGVQSWQPAHTADAAMLDAFRAHQLTDKGFGASAGWTAPKVLADAFRRHGYTVSEASSPWALGASDAALIADLAHGFADAAAETGRIPPADVASWRGITRHAAIVGHTDTLAIPG